MARGSVGDVTFYRLNGQQVARARNRSPHNPNTYPQLVQRAITATVGRAYAAGKVIFDHSFEGKKVPSGSAERFRKVNANILRQVVVSEIQEAIPAAECDAALVARGTQWPVPNAYRISEGSLIQGLFTIAPWSDDANLLLASMPAPIESETIMAYASRNGMSAGDIYTLVSFGIVDPNWEQSGEANYYTQFECAFGFTRLIVKANISTLATPMATATWEDLFTVETTNSYFVKSDLVTDGIRVDEVIANAVTGGLGVIRSEENQGLRSTSDMVLPSVSDWGIKSPYISDAWDPAVAKFGSELILEGGNF